MTTYVAVFALIMAYVALVAAYVALRTLARVRRATRILARGTRAPGAQESLIEATERHAELTAETMNQVATLAGQVEQLRRDGAGVPAGVSAGLRNLALVRYDAFAGMSGRLSFSLALLDERGDGVTLSALVGQSDTRIYAKGVTGRNGEHELSPEEEQAVRAAMTDRPRERRKSA